MGGGRLAGLERPATVMPLQHQRLYITGWSSFTDADWAPVPCRGELIIDGLGFCAGPATATEGQAFAQFRTTHVSVSVRKITTAIRSPMVQ